MLTVGCTRRFELLKLAILIERGTLTKYRRRTLVAPIFKGISMVKLQGHDVTV